MSNLRGVHSYAQEFQCTLPGGATFKAAGGGWELRDPDGVLTDHSEEWPWKTERDSPVDRAARKAGLTPIS
jgi:hypothetical protein